MTLAEQIRAIATATNPVVDVQAVTVPVSLLMRVAEELDA
jgi:hypothetical protein